MAKPIVGVVIDGEETFHLPGVDGLSDYDTLCGIDADDPAVGHDGICPVPEGKRVTCKTCYRIWRGVKRLTISTSDFVGIAL